LHRKSRREPGVSLRQSLYQYNTDRSGTPATQHKAMCILPRVEDASIRDDNTIHVRPLLAARTCKRTVNDNNVRVRRPLAGFR